MGQYRQASRHAGRDSRSDIYLAAVATHASLLDYWPPRRPRWMDGWMDGISLVTSLETKGSFLPADCLAALLEIVGGNNNEWDCCRSDHSLLLGRSRAYFRENKFPTVSKLADGLAPNQEKRKHAGLVKVASGSGGLDQLMMQQTHCIYGEPIGFPSKVISQYKISIFKEVFAMLRIVEVLQR